MHDSEREVTQSCPTLHDPMDFSPPGSSVHGILQARVLEWYPHPNTAHMYMGTDVDIAMGREPLCVYTWEVREICVDVGYG